MRRLVMAVLVLAAVAASGAASAQKGMSTGPNLDGIENARRIEENALRQLEVPRKAGLEVLGAQNFVEAEKQFADLVSRDPTTSDANYLMGLALKGQKKWDQAKTYLSVAVTKEPKRADAKGRLAVAALMTDDIPIAQTQRDELVAMKKQYNGSCPDATAITSNITMIDKVVAALNAPPTPPAAPG